MRLAVAYWRDGGVYPRAGGTRRRHEVYWRNIATMVATWQHVGGAVADTTVDVCTNVEPDGHLRETLDALGARRVAVPFRHVPPEGYFDRFSGALYSLDVLGHYAEHLDADEHLVLVDPDVVWAARPDRLLARLARDGLVVHEVPYAVDRRDLGVTRADLGALVHDIAHAAGAGPGELAALPPTPAYTGGELVAADLPSLRRIVPLCAEAWEGSLSLWRAGRRPVLHTEEHVFAHVVARLGWTRGNSDGIIRRVWTRGAGARNVRAADLDLEAWHVLTEKTHGLWRLYDDLRGARGPFAASGEDYRRLLARRVGVVPGRGLRARLGVEGAVRRLLGRDSLGNEG